jgi:TPR repeat protein
MKLKFDFHHPLVFYYHLLIKMTTQSKSYSYYFSQNVNGVEMPLHDISTYNLNININDAKAIYKTAISHFNGLNGAPVNKNLSIILYMEAIRLGSADAMVELGHLYEIGDYVDQDGDEAVRLYSLAASLLHCEGQFSLGNCFEYGIGVVANKSIAMRLYKLAAEAGSQYAQYTLYEMYDVGYNVGEDKVLANYYLDMATNNSALLRIAADAEGGFNIIDIYDSTVDTVDTNDEKINN